MNNGNTARQLDDMPQAENPSAEQWQQQEGNAAQRDRAIDRGDQAEAVETAQEQPTLRHAPEVAKVALKDLYRASDGTTYSSREQVIDYERGLRD